MGSNFISDAPFVAIVTYDALNESSSAGDDDLWGATMSVDQQINLLAGITLIEMMMAIGLDVNLSDVVKVAKDWQLATRAAVASYIVFPGAAVGLLFLFHASPLVATGFLVLAACPGAPYAPPFTGMAKGDVPIAVGLMVTLAASSAILTPLLLGILLPITAGTSDIALNIPKMVGVLLGAQLFPLFVGLWIRRRPPSFADRLVKPARLLSVLFNLLTFGAIILAQYQMLKQIRINGLAGMLGLVIVALVAGRLLAGPAVAAGKSFVLTTAVRNAGVGLVIVTASFPGTPAITSATAYALFQTIAVALIALVWGRLSPGIHLVDQRAA